MQKITHFKPDLTKLFQSESEIFSGEIWKYANIHITLELFSIETNTINTVFEMNYFWYYEKWILHKVIQHLQAGSRTWNINRNIFYTHRQCLQSLQHGLLGFTKWLLMLHISCWQPTKGRSEQRVPPLQMLWCTGQLLSDYVCQLPPKPNAFTTHES